MKRADDLVLVTVGRAAEMLGVSRIAVHWFAQTGQLRGEWVEGTRRSPRQLLFRKCEVRAFLLSRAERQRRRPATYGPQLTLPLRAVAESKAIPWSRIRPAMLRARLSKAKATLDDRQGKGARVLRLSARGS